MPASTHGRKILYLGTDPSSYERDGCVIHYPVIKIMPKPSSDPSIQTMLDTFSLYTHILLTSKNAVEIFCGLLKEKKISEAVLHSKRWVSIGEVTTKRLALFGISASLTSKVSTQEGLVDGLKELDMKEAYVLLPKSSLSRPVLSSFLKQEGISHALVDLYDTVVNTSLPPINLLELDEIVFTSPSTVHAFFSYGMAVPDQIRLTAIGPITQAALDEQNLLSGK